MWTHSAGVCIWKTSRGCWQQIIVPQQRLAGRLPASEVLQGLVLSTRSSSQRRQCVLRRSHTQGIYAIFMRIKSLRK